MGHVLDITDGTTTVNLATSNGTLRHYTPATPKVDTVEYTPKSLRSGGELIKATRRNVTESAQVLFGGASLSVVRGYINSLNELFNEAEQYHERKVGSRVYVQFQPGATGDTYRSEILTGKVVLSSGALEYQWNDGKIEVQVVWTRRWYWEGPEAIVSLSNKDGDITAPSPSASTGTSFTASTKTIADSNNGLGGIMAGSYIVVSGSTSNDGVYTVNSTAGLPASFTVNESLTDESAGDTVTIVMGVRVYNHLDSDTSPSHGNYLLFSSVSGELPTPARLEFINSYNSSGRANTVYISRTGTKDVTSAFHLVLEGEDASGGTSTASGTASGGYYNAVTWSGDTEQEVLTWTLSTAALNSMAGYKYRALMRVMSWPTTSVKFRLKVKVSTSTLWQGPQVTPGAENIADLGSVQLPPYLISSGGDMYPLSLILTAQKTGGGSLYLDFINLFQADRFRKLISLGYQFGYQVRLVDDETLGDIWTDNWATAGKVGNYIAEGAQVELDPFAGNTIFVLHTNDTGGAPIDRTLEVIARYRPRRLVL